MDNENKIEQIKKLMTPLVSLEQLPNENILERWDKVYHRYRGQIEHENDLYNQRTHWLIFIQAMLFAAFALLMRTRFSGMVIDGVIADISAIVGIYVVLAIICLLGIRIGSIATRTLDNAGEALNEIRDMWTILHQEVMEEKYRSYFPHVSGGLGTVRIRRDKEIIGTATFWSLGRLLELPTTWNRSRLIPFQFQVAWSIILVVLAGDLMYLIYVS